jgi:hypothetical protein
MLFLMVCLTAAIAPSSTGGLSFYDSSLKTFLVAFYFSNDPPKLLTDSRSKTRLKRFELDDMTVTRATLALMRRQDAR